MSCNHTLNEKLKVTSNYSQIGNVMIFNQTLKGYLQLHNKAASVLVNEAEKKCFAHICQTLKQLFNCDSNHRRCTACTHTEKRLRRKLPKLNKVISCYERPLKQKSFFRHSCSVVHHHVFLKCSKNKHSFYPVL